MSWTTATVTTVKALPISSGRDAARPSSWLAERLALLDGGSDLFMPVAAR